ncbi:MAG: 4-alpha-glucanotransferase [Chromatiales bacterium 21-64-14]|nr:MAG: 4-alpha-glucanotransferase [Chromatiales bacterium 21-64-14]HQU15047.1 4-alpha-glucanotransferase [Gammaproteobacteria bacterium]
MTEAGEVLDRRRAGVLLHPTSLPGPDPSGNLGPDAYWFVNFLQDAGFGVWQTLPLGPTHEDGSPYQCLSVNAGDPRLISRTLLVQWGWLDAADPAFGDPRLACVAACAGFMSRANGAERAEYDVFLAESADWLEDYALFQALRDAHDGKPWNQWPRGQRDRAPKALSRVRRELGDAIERIRFTQFLFHRQWRLLRTYANERGILLFGDLPIFVSYDSAEVWAQREYFALDEHGCPVTIAGVPPDYFSATGQRWGNPHYRWDRMEGDGFRWWVQRVGTQSKRFDLMRIDHFRGFEAYWEIAADAPTAMEGRWVQAPGDALFRTLQKTLGPRIPLVAEDLGLITPQVEALRQRYGFPGMKVLQFAFDGAPDNPYLPHRHEENGVVYTGTHDNNTSLGWFDGLPEDGRHAVREYLGHPSEPMPWPLIRSALASVARLAVLPLQDVLCLGADHRMNRPGTTHGNWRWRFAWDWFPQDAASRMRHLIRLYGRVPANG